MSAVNRYHGRFHEQIADDCVVCSLCPHLCAIAPSRSGICGVRSNRDGRLVVDGYGSIAGLDFVTGDDLPLFHYKPGHAWMRVAGKGCTMRCPFCNTYKFSQSGAVRAYKQTPQQVVATALEKRCDGISFGVSEPAPIQEFVFDVFAGAKAAGLDTHLATSGNWSTDALREMLAVTDAITIGLKGLDEQFLETKLGADPTVILNNVDMVLSVGTHLEVSWLLIPGISDTREQVRTLEQVLDKHERIVPIILLPYAPDFTWKTPAATTLEQLTDFRGNVFAPNPFLYIHHDESTCFNTCCSQCNRPLVRRGFAGLIVTSHPSGKAKTECPSCGCPVPYVV